MALIEKAAGQGHAYAMVALGEIHHEREEYEHAGEWYTKVGRCWSTPGRSRLVPALESNIR